ncbi:unnamed protein product [Lactuca virosa]|uniref:Uncharacterized protein n=1 Tax=Lactuca virosa TaxID=75947 RepID=A0AAU9PFL3_9ASTR|nr:unnamed protein product [Lactuca virosa]
MDLQTSIFIIRNPESLFSSNKNIRNPKFAFFGFNLLCKSWLLKVQFTSLKMGRRFLLLEATTRMKKEKNMFVLVGREMQV